MSGPLNYPGADRTTSWKPQFAGGATFTKITKLVLHSTESSGLPGYPSFAPQLTYDPWKHEWYQHMPLNRSATTLADPSSTKVRENRDDVLQVEIVGYADKSRPQSRWISEIDTAGLRDLGELVAWLHEHWGLPLRARPAVEWLRYPKSYGNTKFRMSGPEFDAYEGVLGHQHVSGNDHGDPGDIDIDKIMDYARAGGGPKPAPTKPVPPSSPVTTTAVTVAPISPGSIHTPFGQRGPSWSWDRDARGWGKHGGDDWHNNQGAAEIGKPIRAVAAGQVLYAGNGGGWGPAFGNHVLVESTHLVGGEGSKRTTVYAHMNRTPAVHAGEHVDVGDKLGELGMSGNVSGPHLHLEQHLGRLWTSPRVKPTYSTIPLAAGGGSGTHPQEEPVPTVIPTVRYTPAKPLQLPKGRYAWLPLNAKGDLSFLSGAGLVDALAQVTVDQLVAGGAVTVQIAAYDRYKDAKGKWQNKLIGLLAQNDLNANGGRANGQVYAHRKVGATKTKDATRVYRVRVFASHPCVVTDLVVDASITKL